MAAFYTNGTPVGADSVAAGETIYFQSSLSWPGLPTCYYEGGALTIGLPNGSNASVTPIGGVPLITENTSINSTQAFYIVDPADVSGGFLSAVALYRNGTAHLGANNINGINATTPILVFFQETPLNVSKNATTAIVRTYNWTIDKNGSASNLTLAPGVPGAVNYTVTVTPTLASETFAVTGAITIRNPSQFANATVTNVSDVVDGVAASVDCGAPLPLSLAPNQTLVCTYNATLPTNATLNNTVVVNTTGDIGGGTAQALVDFTNASVTVIDETVVVNDTYAGLLGNASAGNATVFNYTRTFNETNCSNETLQYNNTAVFVTTDTNATGSDSFSVNVSVPCLPLGCTLTQGYWKTHADPTRKQFDETWLELPQGPNSTFYLSNQTWLQVFNTPVKGNAYYQLAHQFMAASLNVLNDASAPANVTSALANATTLLSTYAPAQVAALPKNSPVRQEFIYLAGILGSYNEGLIGPGHCNETNGIAVV